MYIFSSFCCYLIVHSSFLHLFYFLLFFYFFCLTFDTYDSKRLTFYRHGTPTYTDHNIMMIVLNDHQLRYCACICVYIPTMYVEQQHNTYVQVSTENDVNSHILTYVCVCLHSLAEMELCCGEQVNDKRIHARTHTQHQDRLMQTQLKIMKAHTNTLSCYTTYKYKYKHIRKTIEHTCIMFSVYCLCASMVC